MAVGSKIVQSTGQCHDEIIVGDAGVPGRVKDRLAFLVTGIVQKQRDRKPRADTHGNLVQQCTKRRWVDDGRVGQRDGLVPDRVVGTPDAVVLAPAAGR